jgi:transcription antitermination factor NusG
MGTNAAIEVFSNPLLPQDTGGSWYAIHTRSRHEKVVVQRLAQVGVETYLPIVMETRRWSDRKKLVEIPLFGCYIFARLAATRNERLRVLTVEGVLEIVGNRGEGLAIPPAQIDAVRMVIENSLPFTAHPFLKIGQRVRIRSGALQGMEGTLVSRNGSDTLVISIDALHRSLAVRIEGYQVEAA